MSAPKPPPNLAPQPVPPRKGRVRQPSAAARAAAAPPPAKGALEVDLPVGGRLTLNDAEEVHYWETSARRYIQDYGLIKANDLVLLGAILSQGVAMFRAQRLLSDPKAAANAVNLISKASEQIRELEKALGIDKKAREAGGQHTVQDYVTRLKRAAYEKGVHISERTKAYEAVIMEASWKIRLLRNGDEEDRAHHGISEKTIVDWLENEIAKLTEKEKTWSAEKGKVFVGRL